MSKIMRAALDPSCLLCLTPQGWWSPLRQGVMWPGSPRNFATEPATWRDFLAKWAKLTNYTVEIDFEIFSFASGDSIFRTNLASGLALYINSNLRLQYMMGLLYTDVAISAGDRIISKFQVSGTQVREYHNGTLVKEGAYASNIIPAVPTSSANIRIHRIRLSDDDSGKQILSYPSISERLRLITTNQNILAGDQHFMAANAEIAAAIAVPLHIHDRGSMTFLWRGRIPQSVTSHCWIGWGSYEGQRVALHRRMNENILRFRFNYEGTNGVDVNDTEFSAFDQDLSIACVCDFESHTGKLYVGKELKKSVVIADSVTGFNLPTSSVYNALTLGNSTLPAMAPCESLLFFEKALSAEQIAYLCK